MMNMMKRLTQLTMLLTLLLLFLPVAVIAQSGYTTVTATVTDPSGAPYSSGSVFVTFYAGTSGVQPLLNGSTFQTSYASTLTSAGVMSLSLPDNSVIAKSGATGTQWIFTFRDVSGAIAFSYQVTISGSSQNISSGVVAAAKTLPSVPVASSTQYPVLTADPPAALANTVRVYQKSGGLYEIDQNASVTAIGGGAASWSALTSGTNTNTGTFQLSQSGVFSGTQENLSLFSQVGGTCNFTNTFGSGALLTDALTGCVTIPTSGVTNGWSSGVTGIAWNPNPNSTGAHGTVWGVGVTGFGISNAANNQSWGGNFLASDQPSTGGGNNVLQGVESDISAFHTNDTGYAFHAFVNDFGGEVQPTGVWEGLRIEGDGTGVFNTGIDITSNALADNTNAISINRGVLSITSRSGGVANAQFSPVRITTADTSGANTILTTLGSSTSFGSYGFVDDAGVSGIGIGQSGTGNGSGAFGAKTMYIASATTAGYGISYVTRNSTGNHTFYCNSTTTPCLTGAASGQWTFASAPKLPTFTVSTLPSASTSGAGATVIVTDATTFTVGTCTGGGSDTMIAVSNGTTWSCH